MTITSLPLQSMDPPLEAGTPAILKDVASTAQICQQDFTDVQLQEQRYSGGKHHSYPFIHPV
ncbi:hypothetical protein [Fictibacillus sp. NRS-1165]|uniref:hypothetical protein n=1 Tax=Fictibacillus sp. NRS-1165 TaxID=3144463 RepID=UPI003D21E6F0